MMKIQTELIEYIGPQWILLYAAIIIIAWTIIELTPVRWPMIILTILLSIPIYLLLTYSLGPENTNPNTPGPKEINAPGQPGFIYWLISFIPGALLSIIVGVGYKIVHKIKIEKEIKEKLKKRDL